MTIKYRFCTVSGHVIGGSIVDGMERIDVQPWSDARKRELGGK